MQDCLDLACSQRIVSDGAAELPLVHVVHIAGAVQILELLHVGEVVHHEDVGEAVGIQLVNQIAADKARASGNDQHILRLLLSAEYLSEKRHQTATIAGFSPARAFITLPAATTISSTVMEVRHRRASTMHVSRLQP